MEECKESPWGQIPNHWRISSVKEETDVVTDYVANGSFASLAENVKYKSEKDYAVLIRLVDYNNQFKGDFVYIDKNAYEFLGKSKLYGDEIIISNVGANVGTVFKCPHLEYKMSLAPNSIMVKFKGNNDFYYYWLKSHFGQHMLQSIVTGSAQPKFNKTNFKDLQIPVPPLDEQESIASILKSLDDKIEVNRRINDNLEQQAQVLFKSWFVDFEPFRDQPFVKSELGMIPEGWRVGTIGELLEIKYGKDHKKLSDGEIPVYGSGGLMRKCECALYNGESVLIPRKGTLNNVMYVNEAFWTVDTMFYSIPKIDNVVLFTYLYLSGKDLASMNSGSAVPSMTTEILNNMLIVIPTEMVIRDFNITVTSIYSRIKHGNEESRRLAQLRDTLQPRLMSGELKVNEIENAI